MTGVGRKQITCIKRLPSGVMERFKVIVMAEELDKAVKKYEEQGYMCIRGER